MLLLIRILIGASTDHRMGSSMDHGRWVGGGAGVQGIPHTCLMSQMLTLTNPHMTEVAKWKQV